MREIKFRAWDIEREGYIQGFNMVNYHGYFNKGIKKSIYRYQTEWDEEKYILEQYTGLKDKNGKEIYEGDVLSAEERWFKPIVGFENGCFVVANLGPSTSLYDFLEKSHEDFNVIGNIHENPELTEATI